MTARERADSGQFVETVTLKDVLGVFDAVRGPVITSSDVADALDCTTEAARQKLTRLYDQGRVDKRKTGRTVAYWRPEDAPREERDDDAPARTREASAESGASGDASATGSDTTLDARERDDGDAGAGEKDTGGARPLDRTRRPDSAQRDRVRATVAELSPSWGEERVEKGTDAIMAAYGYLQSREAVSMREFVNTVAVEHPVGYDIEPIDEGERYRGAWWRKLVKPTLAEMPGVVEPEHGGQPWEFDPAAP